MEEELVAGPLEPDRIGHRLPVRTFALVVPASRVQRYRGVLGPVGEARVVHRDGVEHVRLRLAGAGSVADGEPLRGDPVDRPVDLLVAGPEGDGVLDLLSGGDTDVGRRRFVSIAAHRDRVAAGFQLAAVLIAGCGAERVVVGADDRHARVVRGHVDDEIARGRDGRAFLEIVLGGLADLGDAVVAQVPHRVGDRARAAEGRVLVEVVRQLAGLDQVRRVAALAPDRHHADAGRLEDVAQPRRQAERVFSLARGKREPDAVLADIGGEREEQAPAVDDARHVHRDVGAAHVSPVPLFGQARRGKVAAEHVAGGVGKHDRGGEHPLHEVGGDRRLAGVPGRLHAEAHGGPEIPGGQAEADAGLQRAVGALHRVGDAAPTPVAGGGRLLDEGADRLVHRGEVGVLHHGGVLAGQQVDGDPQRRPFPHAPLGQRPDPVPIAPSLQQRAEPEDVHVGVHGHDLVGRLRDRVGRRGAAIRGGADDLAGLARIGHDVVEVGERRGELGPGRERVHVRVDRVGRRLGTGTGTGVVVGAAGEEQGERDREREHTRYSRPSVGPSHVSSSRLQGGGHVTRTPGERGLAPTGSSLLLKGTHRTYGAVGSCQ